MDWFQIIILFAALYMIAVTYLCKRKFTENKNLKKRLEIEAKSLEYLNKVDLTYITKLEKSNNFHIKVNKSLIQKINRQQNKIESYEILEGKKK